MSEKSVLCCTPESRSQQRKLGIINYTAPLGSEKTLCDLCECKVWIGPRQMQFRKENPGTPVVCVSCAAPHLARGESPLRHLGGRGGEYETIYGDFKPDNSKN